MTESDLLAATGNAWKVYAANYSQVVFVRASTKERAARIGAKSSGVALYESRHGTHEPNAGAAACKCGRWPMGQAELFDVGERTPISRESVR